MILMALDDVRDFVGTRANPVNLDTTTVPLFFTRWITHFCAPVFFLTMGMGAYFALGRRSKPQLSRFLLTRGLWPIFLELVPLRCLGFQFNFDYRVTMLFILWALGWAMIILSAPIYLPQWAIITCGAVAICGHNLVGQDRLQESAMGDFAFPGNPLLEHAAHRGRRICLDSMVRCYRRRIRNGTDL